MIEIYWKYKAPNVWTSTYKNMSLVKKILSGSEQYEIWLNNKLVLNKLTYWELLSVLDSGKYKGNDIRSLGS